MWTARITQLRCALASRLFPKRAVGMWEHGATGFGDRLTGIAYLLYLAKAYRAEAIYYQDERCHPWHDMESRRQTFRGQMCDLIDIEGIRFLKSDLPMPQDVLYVEHDSGRGNKMVDLGFPEMRRLKPRNPEIAQRIQSLGLENRNAIGFHVRRTDMIGVSGYEKSHGLETITRLAMDNLNEISRQSGLRRIYLAADNRESQEEWSERLRSAEFQVIVNACTYDPGLWRQTSADDMLVDFFGLAGCARIVRLVPSNFSRYAAWVGGCHYTTSQLC